MIGSVAHGIRNLYAEEFVGAPIPDDSLTLTNTSVTSVNDRLVVSFTRNVVDGYLYKNYNMTDSIVSSFADIIWAVGMDSTSDNNKSESQSQSKSQSQSQSGDSCKYHSNKRGLKIINWEEPEIAMVDIWKC